MASINGLQRGSDEAYLARDARSIAESMVGPCEWSGAEAYICCPGVHTHTTNNNSQDCKIVCERVGTLAPGIYCFHGSCQPLLEKLNYKLRSALGRGTRTKKITTDHSLLFLRQNNGAKRPMAQFDAVKLERLAGKLGNIDTAWLASRSPKRPDKQTPVSFLQQLYRRGENVVIFDVFESQGQQIWTHREALSNIHGLDSFKRGRKFGVWFLANPVTGNFMTNDRGNSSRRSWQNVTSWRYMVVESDSANETHWLAALAQLPLPISAIYTSGGKSIHALVRLDAESKQDWDMKAAELKFPLVTLGADPKAISAVRLTRLPCCERVEKGGMQTLLYLNGNPDNTPISKLPVSAAWCLNWTPAIRGAAGEGRVNK